MLAGRGIVKFTRITQLAGTLVESATHGLVAVVQNMPLFLASLRPDYASKPVAKPTTPAHQVPETPLCAPPVCQLKKVTPIYLAARGGHYDCVKELIEHGAGVHFGTEDKTSTPLHAAVLGNNATHTCISLSDRQSDIITLLIQQG